MLSDIRFALRLSPVSESSRRDSLFSVPDYDDSRRGARYVPPRRASRLAPLAVLRAE
jgi:hypothetical protein